MCLSQVKRVLCFVILHPNGKIYKCDRNKYNSLCDDSVVFLFNSYLNISVNLKY